MEGAIQIGQGQKQVCTTDTATTGEEDRDASPVESAQVPERAREGRGRSEGMFHTPERGSKGEGQEEPSCSAPGKKRLVFSESGGCGDATCAICLSPLKEGNGDEHKGETFVTPCNHEFHLVCLQGCREFKNSTCPLCRAPLPPGLTPVGARQRQAEREREEEIAYNFNISAEYNPNYIAMRAARIRMAVAQRYVQASAG